MVAEAGFDVKIRVVEAATGLKAAEDSDFHLYENTWSGRVDPDGNTVLYQTCGSPLNTGRYCHKEIDELHKEARASSDLATRKKVYEKIAAKFLSNGWLIYVYHPQYLIAHTARLEGFKAMPDGLIRVVDVKLKQVATGRPTMRQTTWRAALALALCLAAGSAFSQSPLRIGLGDDPDVLDPSLSRTCTARIVFAALCDKLFHIDEKANIVPQLASGHEVSADGRTVTIRLRPGVKLHDGEAFDAVAAKYSLDRHLTLKGSFRKPELAQVDTVEVVDPMTIRLNLKTPFLPLLAQLTDRAGMMVSPKAAEATGDKFGLRPMCAGPYRFVERVQQDRIVVERFADYWNKDQVFIDKVTYPPIVDATVRLANVRSGGLDMMERMLATDIKRVRDDARLTLSKAVSISWFALLVNVANGPKADNPLGKDPRVRHAFDLAIDREALNQVVFNGEFVPSNQWVNPQNFYYQSKFPVPGRDVAKAKALLKQAGVGARIPIDFMVSNTPETRAVAEVVQSTVAEAGFDLKIRVTEVATALKQAEDDNFQLYMNTWSGRIDPDGNSVIYQMCGAPQNMGKYCNPEVDKLHEQARAVTDPAQRKAIYETLAARFLADGWILYLYHPQYLIAHTVRLEGFRPMPDGLLRMVGVKLR